MVAVTPPKGVGFKVGIGFEPSNYISVPYILDFTQGNTVVIKDMFQEQSQDIIPFVQSLFIDNSANSAAISILFGGTLHNIVTAPNTQGWFIVAVPQGQCQFTATTLGAVKVPILLASMMVPPSVWTA